MTLHRRSLFLRRQPDLEQACVCRRKQMIRVLRVDRERFDRSVGLESGSRQQIPSGSAILARGKRRLRLHPRIERTLPVDSQQPRVGIAGHLKLHPACSTIRALVHTNGLHDLGVRTMIRRTGIFLTVQITRVRVHNVRIAGGSGLSLTFQVVRFY
jgi:hypothetical protein